MHLKSSEPKIGQFARKSPRISLLQDKIRAIMCLFLAIFRHLRFLGANSLDTPVPLSSKVATLEKLNGDHVSTVDHTSTGELTAPT
jgi:hypothetical protein